MNTISLVSALVGTALALAPLADAQTVNHRDASLVLNRNSVGAAPTEVWMGAFDPNVLELGGEPGALWALAWGAPHAGVEVPGMGTLYVDPAQVWATQFGSLDAEGRATIAWESGDLAQIDPGLVVVAQAAVADRSTASGFRLSGASRATFVPSMSSPIVLVPGQGSTARARAPLSAMVVADAVTVGNLTFSIDGETQFENFARLGDLQLGDFLAVEGYVGPLGFVAESIVLEDPEPEARLSGVVQGVGPAGIVLLGVSVYTTNATTFDDGGTPASLADVVPGMTVEVRIPVGSELFPDATQVLLNVHTEPEPEPESEIEEEIEIEIEFLPPSFCS